MLSISIIVVVLLVPLIIIVRCNFLMHAYVLYTAVVMLLLNTRKTVVGTYDFLIKI